MQFSGSSARDHVPALMPASDYVTALVDETCGIIRCRHECTSSGSSARDHVPALIPASDYVTALVDVDWWYHAIKINHIK